MATETEAEVLKVVAVLQATAVTTAPQHSFAPRCVPFLTACLAQSFLHAPFSSLYSCSWHRPCHHRDSSHGTGVRPRVYVPASRACSAQSMLQAPFSSPSRNKGLSGGGLFPDKEFQFKRESSDDTAGFFSAGSFFSAGGCFNYLSGGPI